MRTFSCLLALLAAGSLAAQEALSLVPRPREAEPLPPMSVAQGLSIATPANPQDRFAVEDLAREMRERGIRVRRDAGGVRVSTYRLGTPAGRAALTRSGVQFDTAMRAEGYVLIARGGRVDVVAATAPGIFYGLQTLKQLAEGTGATARLRGARIRDWPALRWRGFHDDLSRGPVPTLEFQKKQIRTFAAYKINVYSPYYEHTLEYRAHPLIAPPGGAMTREQVRELVDYARQYHITVIPEQEAFGHLHHVLKHERYSPLGETEHGHVLAPGQAGSLPILTQWFVEIDSLFRGPFIHLGADETFELGRGQTKPRVDSAGIGAVYLDFLKRITDTLRIALSPPRYSNRVPRFLFWGDVAMNHPDLVKNLPRDLIAVGWWYDPQPQGFDRFLVPFRDAGMETWVAPGVNNWNRVYPNYNNALPNIQGFVRDGQRLGSTGMLNTSWDDDGDAIFAQTWYGVLFGAAAAWQPGQSSIEEYQRSYGRVFHGDTTGKIDEAQRKLISAHAALQRAQAGDASTYLFWLDPWSAEGRVVAQRALPVAREVRLAAEDAIVLLLEARRQPLRETEALDAIELGARRIDFLAAKFQFAEEIIAMYARARASTDRASAGRDLADITGINGRLQDLRDGYAVLRNLYERAWLAENRPYWMHNVLARFDLSTQLWIERIDRMTAVRREYGRTGRLPAPGDLGIPELAR